jgi:Chaperone of endosialidase
MKIKILCFCFITGFTVIAQVKLGTNTGTVATNANFQVEGTTVSDQFVVLKNANVGVGTNAPTSKLHVVLGSGNGNLTAWDNTAATFGQNGATGSAIGLGFDTTTNAAWISTITPATAWRPLNFLGNNWRFLTNGTTEVFSILNNGNIGIGVSAPAAQFHTTGTVRLAGAGTPAVGKVLTSDASGNATWTAPATSGTVTSVSGTLPITVATGTSTPAISIATANTSTTGAITGTDWTTFNNKIGSASNGLLNTFGNVTLGGNLSFTTILESNGFNFSLNGGGNLGIGTNSPIAKLHVILGQSTGNLNAWDGNSAAFGQSGSTGSALGVGYDTTNDSAWISSLAPSTAWKPLKFLGNNWRFLANGATEVFSILNNGNIGIGVSAPAAQLHTTGTVRFAGAGTPAVGKVLTSDASGNATWTAPATSGTVTSVTGTLPISVATGTNTPAISIATANTTTTGAITGTDWTTFNNKIGSASNGLTTTSGDVKLGGTLTQATSITLTTTIDNLGIIRDVAGTSGESSNGYANLTIGGSGSGGNSYNTGGKIKLTGFAGTEAGTITGYEGSGQRIMSLKGGAATGTNGMYLLNSGNIGIGVEVPAAQFHTTGTVRFAGAGTPAVGKVLTSDASGNATWTAPATSGTVTSVSGTLPITVATGTSTPAISIATANTTTTGAITGTDWTTFNNKIGTASNGLTTTSGDVKLGGTLTQATTIGLTSTIDNLKIVRDVAGATGESTNGYATLSIGGSGLLSNSSFTGGKIKLTGYGGADNGSIAAYEGSGQRIMSLKGGGATGTNGMYLLNSGNIGIGVEVPTAQLHTSGTIKFAGAGTPGSKKVLTSDSSGNATWEDKTTLYSGDGTLTSNRIISMSDTVDNLKIIRDVPGTSGETTTGYATLSIGGAGINGGDSSFTGGKIKLTGYQGNDFGSIAAYEASSQRIMSIKGGAATGTNGMYFLSSGNIGIGVEVPTAQLHTTGTVKFSGAGTPGANKVLTSDGSGNATWQSANAITNIYNADGTLTGPRTLTLGTGNDLRIVGSNTQSLELRGPKLSNWGDMIINANSDGGATLGAEHILMQVRGNELMRIEDGGNVGIGSTNPLGKFQINAGGSSTDGLIVRATADWDALSLSHDGNTAFLNASGADSGIAFRTNTLASGDAVSNTYTEQMRILPNGNVGIGISNPTQKLSIQSSGTTTSLKLEHGGSNLLIRPETSGGLNTIIENTAGQLIFNSKPRWANLPTATSIGANLVLVTDAAGNMGYRDGSAFVTANSGALNGQRLFDVSPSNVGQAVTIVAAGGNNGVSFAGFTANTEGCLYVKSTNGGKFVSFFNNSNTMVGSISDNGGSTGYNTTSDKRLKENIVDTKYSLKDLMKIEVKDYNYKSNKETTTTGFIAQDLYKIYKTAVSPGDYENEIVKTWSVDYSKLTPLLVKSIQDQQTIIDQQSKDIEDLKNALKMLLNTNKLEIKK